MLRRQFEARPKPQKDFAMDTKLLRPPQFEQTEMIEKWPLWYNIHIQAERDQLPKFIEAATRTKAVIIKVELCFHE